MNKLYEKIMNGANVSKETMNKLCDWIDSNINDGYLTEDDAKVDKYERNYNRKITKPSRRNKENRQVEAGNGNCN